MTIALPNGIRQEDTKYPRFSRRSTVRFIKALKMHYTERFGWCVATLLISRASGRRSGMQDRTYAYTLDGKVVRVGLGPHVLRTIDLYVTSKNEKRLAKFVTLAEQGEAKAGDIRDRISTRRARTADRRTWLG